MREGDSALHLQTRSHLFFYLQLSYIRPKPPGLSWGFLAFPGHYVGSGDRLKTIFIPKLTALKIGIPVIGITQEWNPFFHPVYLPFLVCKVGTNPIPNFALRSNETCSFGFEKC